MWTRQYRKTWLRYCWFPALAAAACCYFYYHAIEGRFGLEQSEVYAQQIASLQNQLAALSSERIVLKARTEALSNGSLERDMIDEQARKMLGLSSQNELVLLHGSN
ncbi:MAG: septum formation initiator family protein [Pseudomonadota bacterium]